MNINEDRQLRAVLFTSKCQYGLAYADSMAIPLGLYIIKKYLEDIDVACDICDFDVSLEDPYVKKIQEGFYDIVGFSPTHWNKVMDVELIFKLKRINSQLAKKALFIAGGHTATIDTRSWLEYGIDLTFLGHAESALVKVITKFRERKDSLNPETYSDIKGIAYLNANGDLVKNIQARLDPEEFEHSMYSMVKEMDLPYEKYWDSIRSRSSKILNANKRSYVVENARLYTSNRCVAVCGFCSSVGFLPAAHDPKFAKKFMGLTPIQILDLIKTKISRYGARAFSINDDDFLVGGKPGIDRAMQLCDLIIDAKSKGDIPSEIKFSCQTRVGNFIKYGGEINHDLMDAMLNAGFHNVSVGVETFSGRLMKAPSINKIGISPEKAELVLNAFIDHGLYATINLILIIPESTPQDLLSTIEVAIDYLDKPIQVSTSKMMRLFPGAPIWESGDYQSIDEIVKNDLNGEEIRIPVYCKPRDESLLELAEELDELAAAELVEFKETYGISENQLLPRIVITLTIFRAIARFFNEENLIANINNRLDVIARESGNTATVSKRTGARFSTDEVFADDASCS